jgi:DNA-binding transcriptional LysR family regulator
VADAPAFPLSGKVGSLDPDGELLSARSCRHLRRGRCGGRPPSRGCSDKWHAADSPLRSTKSTTAAGGSGSLRIAAFASAVTDMLAPALAEFARTRPDVEVTLTSVEPHVAHPGLIDDGFDLALTFDYDIDPQTPPAVVERELLTEDPVVAALPAGHPLATRKAIRFDLLASEPWIAAPLAGLPLTALREAAGTGFTPQVR